MSQNITLKMAFEGFIIYKQAIGRSPNTIAEYRSTLKKLMLHFDESTKLSSLGRGEVIAFFSWLQEDYTPGQGGVAPRPQKSLSQKSIYNVHAVLSAFWNWTVDEGYVDENPLKRIERPEYSPPVIEPFSKADIQAMLEASKWSSGWESDPSIRSRRATAERDIAIILTLLDTGVRASELCGISIRDLDINRKQIKVRGKGPGGEGKERIVFVSAGTAKAIWKALAPRMDTVDQEDFVFVVGPKDSPREMTRTNLGKLISRIGERAGVDGAHPHRFRHTFAINYLRNGGDLFTLQALLGHSDLTMVKRYARIANTDSERVHKTASPVANWNLR